MVLSRLLFFRRGLKNSVFREFGNIQERSDPLQNKIYPYIYDQYIIWCKYTLAGSSGDQGGEDPSYGHGGEDPSGGHGREDLSGDHGRGDPSYVFICFFICTLSFSSQNQKQTQKNNCLDAFTEWAQCVRLTGCTLSDIFILFFYSFNYFYMFFESFLFSAFFSHASVNKMYVIII